jgi:hypothetical protein
MSNGRYVPISSPRRWVGDLLAVSRNIPLVPFERRMNLARLALARKAAGVSWCAVFVKAFGLVSQRRPDLRQSILSFPWRRLFECSSSSAMVAVERQWQGQAGVFFGEIPEPENLALVEIEAALRHLKTSPIESIRHYRRLLRVSRLPRPLRRAAWWFAHEVDGPTRVKYFGTFGISVTAGEGATALSLISPATTTLHYGVMESNGDIEVRLTFDHRVLDGAPIARGLSELEMTLNGEILRETLHTAGISQAA